MSIKGQGHFLTLAQGNFYMKIKTCFPQKPLGNFNQDHYHLVCKLQGNENLIYQHDTGHMTKMAAMPIYGKTLQKSSAEPVYRFPRNLVCSIRGLSPS